MFDRLKGIFSQGVSARYSVDRALYRHPFFTISAGREKKSMRPVLVKEYTREGRETEAKLDRHYRAKPLAKVLPEIRHEHIVTTIEAQHGESRRIEILENVTAPMLRALLDKGQFSAADFRNLVMAAGAGLAHLHSLGFVHRGLAPEGIAVGEDGNAKIMDLSLLMDQSHVGPNCTTVGPHGYVAPEVISRRGCDVRSDVYALGAVCYEILCGMHLFPNAHGYEGLVRMMNTKPATLSERGADVPAELEAVVMKAVERNPRDRYQTMDEMLAAFANAPEPHTIRPATRVTLPAFAA